MLTVRLSFRQLKKYLASLLEKGLLITDDNFGRRRHPIWRTTEKGLSFIKCFEETEGDYSLKKKFLLH